MNERILSPQLLKLVQEAGPGYSLADPKWVKKFAELIVAECAEVITETRWHLPPTQQQIAIGIKEHFGVNE